MRGHLDGLVAAWNDPAVWRWVGAGSRTSYSRQELDDVLRSVPERGLSFADEWVVARAEDGVVLGTVWFAPWWIEDATEGTPVLGYRYGGHAWGHGYGGEAAVMAEARRRGHRRVESSALPDNTASHRILLRLGFRPTDARPLPGQTSRVAQWYAWGRARGRDSLLNPTAAVTHRRRRRPSPMVGATGRPTGRAISARCLRSTAILLSRGG